MARRSPAEAPAGHPHNGTLAAARPPEQHCDLQALTPRWNALADGLQATPFLRPGWISAWWRAFGRGRLEIISTADAGGGLGAVLPIVRRGATVSSPTNWHTPQFGLLAADRPAGDSVVGQLFARRAQQFSLGFLGSREPDLELLMTAAEEARYRFTVRTLERQPLVRVQGPWATYERSLSRNLRRDVGRCRRRLGELGTVSVDVRQDPGALEEAFAVEAAGWKGTAGTAIASRPQTQAFYTDVAEWAAGRGSLRLIFLRVDGRAIAFHLALEEGGTYFPLKGGFDPAFRRHSPGKLIIHATLERAFAVGLQRYEFLGAVDDYKQRWANDVHDRLLFQAFSFTAPGMIRRAAFVYGRPVAKRLIRSATR